MIDPDNVDRVTKLLVDAGDAPTFDDAAELLRTYVLQLVAGADACADPAWQAALLTAANAGRRAMHGGVRVVLEADPVCTVPLAAGRRLSAALAAFGAEAIAAPEAGVPTIAFGAPAAPAASGAPVAPTVWVTAGRWTAAVSTTPRLLAGRADVPAAVLAACLGISEVFQWLRGYRAATDRDLAVSLWDPQDPEADGPPIAELPGALWLLGLGHLGQAYTWLLGLLPYDTAAQRPLVLQDDDRLTAANQATSMLHTDERLGLRKTRLAAGLLDALGWDTRLVERRFAGGRLHDPGDPPILLGGVDNPLARHRLSETGMPLIADAGLGAGPDGFLSITVRRLPASRPSQKLWPAQAPPPRQPVAARGAYAALERQTGDRCGVELLAGRTVATAFVGMTAACFVLGGILRELHGGAALELVDVSLRDPRAITTVAAPVERPPRVAVVAALADRGHA